MVETVFFNDLKKKSKFSIFLIQRTFTGDPVTLKDGFTQILQNSTYLNANILSTWGKNGKLHVTLWFSNYTSNHRETGTNTLSS